MPEVVDANFFEASEFADAAPRLLQVNEAAFILTADDNKRIAFDAGECR